VIKLIEGRSGMADPTDLQQLALRKSTKVERYAEVLAHVVHFGTERTEEVVGRFGFAVHEWRAVDAAWTNELAEGIRRNQQELALRFSAAFAKRRRRLAQDQPALEAVGDPLAKGPEPAAPGAGPPDRSARALPSFMSAASRPSAPSTRVERPLPVAPVPVARLPVAPAAAPPVPPLLALDSAPRVPDAPDPEKPITQALPIMNVTGEPLPFADGVAPDVALRGAMAHADTVQGPKPSRPPSLGSTAPSDGDRLAAIARRILPFKADAGARDSDPGPPPGSPAPSPDGVLSLTLEQHASLHVELALHPDQKTQTLRRYGLSTEHYARLDTAWQAKVALDPTLRASWEQACAQYRTWILRNKQRGA